MLHGPAVEKKLVVDVYWTAWNVAQHPDWLGEKRIERVADTTFCGSRVLLSFEGLQSIEKRWVVGRLIRLSDHIWRVSLCRQARNLKKVKRERGRMVCVKRVRERQHQTELWVRFKAPPSFPVRVCVCTTNEESCCCCCIFDRLCWRTVGQWFMCQSEWCKSYPEFDYIVVQAGPFFHDGHNHGSSTDG